MRAYAVTAKVRVASAPEIPTAEEAGLSDFHMSVWNAIWVPKGTPKEIVAKLNAKMIEIANDADFRARLFAMNVAVPPQTPEEMGQHFAEDSKRCADLIKLTNIKVE